MKQIEDARGGVSSKIVYGAMRPLRAPRANRVFCTAEKHIRTENTVMYKGQDSPGCFYSRSSIAYGYAFHPCAIDDPRGRAAVRASSGHYSSTYHPTINDIVKRPLRAPRANHVFGTDEKRIRSKNMVIDKCNNRIH